MTERVRIERQGDLAEVILNRADKHNGVDWLMLKALLEAAERLRKDQDVRGVILRGDGPSFCAGLDFGSFTKTPARMAQGFLQPGKRGANLFQDVCLRWRRVGAPVIAAIHGNCFGAGLQLALGCDFRFATPDAQLSILEAKWGLIPDMSLTVTLPELMPMDKAKELTMTGRIIPATEAASLNLITRTADDPVAEARALLEQITTRSPDSTAATKALFHKAWMAEEDDALAYERRYQRKLLGGKNQKIAMQRNFKKQDIPFVPRKFKI